MKTVRLCMLALGVSIFAVSADTIYTQTQTLSFGPDYPDFTSTLTFNKFDTWSGVRSLVSVHVLMTLTSSSGTLSVDNDGAEPASVNVALGASSSTSYSPSVHFLDASYQPLLGNLTARTTGSYNLAANDGDTGGQFDAGGLDYALMQGDTVTVSTGGYVNSAFLSEFQKNGGDVSFDIDTAVSQVLNFGSVGGVAGSFSPVTGSGSVTLVYEYVPEPASLTLLALGGIVFLHRRRQVRV